MGDGHDGVGGWRGWAWCVCMCGGIIFTPSRLQTTAMAPLILPLHAPTHCACHMLRMLVVVGLGMTGPCRPGGHGNMAGTKHSMACSSFEKVSKGIY